MFLAFFLLLGSRFSLACTGQPLTSGSSNPNAQEAMVIALTSANNNCIYLIHFVTVSIQYIFSDSKIAQGSPL